MHSGANLGARLQSLILEPHKAITISVICSASNAVALQVGGALGVAVIGSTLATRYQSHLSVALNEPHISFAVRKEILGSLGGALAVSLSVGGETGMLLARAARNAFMSGVEVAFFVGAVVALFGAVVMVARLPSRARDTPMAYPMPLRNDDNHH